MDEVHFDAMTRSLTAAPSRRGLLAALTGGFLGGLLFTADGDHTAAKNRNRNRRRNRRRREQNACTPDCTGKSCGAPDGCGGTCTAQTCQSDETCVDGKCQKKPVMQCQPGYSVCSNRRCCRNDMKCCNDAVGNCVFPDGKCP